VNQFELPHGFKIVSGGQTGADRAGLDWAIAHQVGHGGWCPKGRRAEDGTVPTQYELTETPSAGYLQRTEWNVRDSDATIIFTLADKLTGGSLKTAGFAAKLRKPYVHISPRVAPKHLAQFLAEHSVRTLNVAGNRESVAPGIYDRILEVLSEALILTK
jgi:hypothetical protein